MSRRIEIPPRDTSAPVRVPRNRTAAPPPQSKKPSGVFNERHTAAQDVLYREWINQQQPLVFTFDDGTAVTGVLQSYDTYALSVEDTNGGPLLIFKQSLRTIQPG